MEYKVCGWYIQFVFLVLHLQSIRFTSSNLCAINKSAMKYQPELDWKADLTWFNLKLLKVHVCWFLDFRSSQLFTFNCGVINKTWRCSLLPFEHVSLWCLFFDPHPIIHQSNIAVQSKKSIWITPTYLSGFDKRRISGDRSTLTS